jgi:isopentenyldiphosphate isomerase
MMRTAILAAVYGWLGFTCGWFFRKWLDSRWAPAFRQSRVPAGEPAPSVPERVDWVDEQGRVLDSLTRTAIRQRNLLHPVTATFVFHPDGRLFVHQRTLTKDVYPGRFDVCVGGTVVSGETFAANAVREVAEELRIRGAPVYALFRHRFQDEATHSLIQVFACVHGGAVTLQPEEVAAGFWADRAAVAELIRAGNVCPDSAQGWRMYVERYGEANFARELAPAMTPAGISG